MTPFDLYDEQRIFLNKYPKDERLEILLSALQTYGSQQKPIKAYILEEHFTLKKTELMELVRTGRRQGHIIVAVSEGYYLGSTIRDLKIIKDDLEKRIKSMKETIQQLVNKHGYDFDVVFFFAKRKPDGHDPNQLTILDEIEGKA